MGARIRGDLADRTLSFAVSLLSAIDGLPPGTRGWVVGRQLARSGTSIGANVWEAEEAMTDADFAHKCSIARKEASETRYWLALCEQAGLLTTAVCDPLREEAVEHTKILATIVHKTQDHIARQR
ncbi:MAG: four helix bundle protein [Planctomycetota bacterium]|nr:four helix bundle protein [Planctomycetota bacterium]